MLSIGRVVLFVAAFLVMAGGLYDLFTPRLPENLDALCGGMESARRLARELLRALGGSLVAIGMATALLVARMGSHPDRWPLAIVLVLVIPAESINAATMRRVGSPFYIPLSFSLLAIVGVILSWPRP